ncbi:MAG: hypothetical protein WCD69_03225 [Xanthobacteraceae bacterium]
MSALPPKADIHLHSQDVRFVPNSGLSAPQQKSRYSLTSSVKACREIE